MNRYTLAMSYNKDGTLKESKMVPVSKEDSPDQYNYFRADMVKAEIDEALSIINRFANFDIYNERADALHMVAVRFLDKHEYKGE